MEVYFDHATSHWVFKTMWLSSHDGTAGERSEQVGYWSAEFPARYRAHPRIWVAVMKHANYKSVAACRQSFTFPILWGDYHDICVAEGPNYAIRFPVTTANNVGSRFSGTSCVSSRNFSSPREECYYHPAATWEQVGPYPNPESFRGWQTQDVYGPAPPSYYEFLMSDKFESYYGDWGPGPAPPTLTASINGPTEVTAQTTGQWAATARHGYAPYTYEWRINQGPVLGTGSSFSRGMGNQGSWFYLDLTIIDAQGQMAVDRQRVVAVGSNGTLWE